MNSRTCSEPFVSAQPSVSRVSRLHQPPLPSCHDTTDPANDTTAGCPSTPHVISKEEEVKLNEDELDGVVGDGIGEDGGVTLKTTTSPRIRGGGSVAPSPTHKPGFSCRPFRPWIRSAFETAVAQCEDRDSDGVPRVYSRDYTFWSRPTATYFNPQG
jgi:hypothetical protein